MKRAGKSKYTYWKDEELMTGIHQGDTSAFDELYDRYHKRLLYYFYRMLGNSTEKAADFMQDLFVKIIEKPGLFDPNRKLATWLFSVAHNMCKNEYRRLQVRQGIIGEDTLDEYESEEILQEGDRLTADQIFAEIDRLAEAEKTAFLLYYREDFTLREIGQILNLPEGTVKSKLFYTRKRIVRKLNPEGK